MEKQQERPDKEQAVRTDTEFTISIQVNVFTYGLSNRCMCGHMHEHMQNVYLNQHSDLDLTLTHSLFGDWCVYCTLHMKDMMCITTGMELKSFFKRHPMWDTEHVWCDVKF